MQGRRRISAHDYSVYSVPDAVVSHSIWIEAEPSSSDVVEFVRWTPGVSVDAMGEAFEMSALCEPRDLYSTYLYRACLRRCGHSPLA
ncbi:hypothetical protein GCM10009655_28310 [Rhodoglobus aureus]|uniref:Uncharacterized protein n=1 Tax=Rhodoglobus aureus TaxID=191497 RepID=A0ABN1VYZ4_9MICO